MPGIGAGEGFKGESQSQNVAKQSFPQGNLRARFSFCQGKTARVFWALIFPGVAGILYALHSLFGNNPALGSCRCRCILKTFCVGSKRCPFPNRRLGKNVVLSAFAPVPQQTGSDICDKTLKAYMLQVQFRHDHKKKTYKK